MAEFVLGVDSNLPAAPVINTLLGVFDAIADLFSYRTSIKTELYDLDVCVLLENTIGQL